LGKRRGGDHQFENKPKQSKQGKYLCAKFFGKKH